MIGAPRPWPPALLPPKPLDGVLFDLDGTLVDSARDLYTALTRLCAERGIDAPPFAAMRETVSRGARAMLACALGDDSAAIGAAVPRFLDLYVDTGMAHTRAFPGVESLLRGLEARGVRWGVVSNKAEALVSQTLAKLGYARRAAAIVGGDTLPQRKPDPAPVLHACGLAAVCPARCVFVGDDPRDVQAGRAAGLYTVAAAWGYLGGGDPAAWSPDAVATSVADLATLLDGA